MPDTLPQGPEVISRLAPQRDRVTRQNGTESAFDNYPGRYPDGYSPARAGSYRAARAGQVRRDPGVGQQTAAVSAR